MITTKIANYCFKIINNIVIRATAKISRGGGAVSYTHLTLPTIYSV